MKHNVPIVLAVIVGVGYCFAAIVLLVALLGAGLLTLRSHGMFISDLTGESMYPHSVEGDLVIADTTAVPQIGDAVVFWTGTGSEAHLVFHRIVGESYAEGGGWITRGDNNDINDAFLVRYKDVVGVESMILPGLGWAATIDGRLVVLLLILVMLIVVGLTLCMVMASRQCDGGYVCMAYQRNCCNVCSTCSYCGQNSIKISYNGMQTNGVSQMQMHGIHGRIRD